MNTTNPFEILQTIAGGYCLNRCLHAVAELGVADVLDETPRTIEDLAGLVKADPDALRRVMRLLSAYHIFEGNDNHYSHTPASQLLRKDHPQSMKAFVRMFGLPINSKAYEGFSETMITGEPAIEKIYPGGLWEYYAEHKDESNIFNDAMKVKATVQLQAIMASYDFSRFTMIGDIGGGQGHLLQAILQSSPHAKGILFDLPHVIKQVEDIASERLTLQAGDFFKDDLPPCDAYLVMEIIHDWADDEAAKILRAIRKAAAPQAKLLLMETMIPEDASPDWSKMLDIHMLALLGGRQRTYKEYERLLATTGFTLNQEIDTGAGVSILEASAT